ncbi:hypothetical protein RPD_1192 [Rhodopseudomonas palustris BisB5]|uniref:Uncharacterized protein n=1 Tax=Rhodopseudomonas palustris (strain BisB5) TaxID=316057 RepID=Q13BV9_RHOPS|nr:hypothetical protein RPD_1192 [Rhodopseudomonas palustris BisB5]
MRAKKPSTRPRKLLPKAITRMIALASHATIGVAVGLGFAFIATRSEVFGIRRALATLDPSGFRAFDFAVTSALAFGIVATITGIALTFGEDD